MKIAVIGTGYVGLPTGVGMAELGHDVICIDREVSKIESLKAGEVTLYEEGLEDLLKKGLASGKLQFTTSMKEGVAEADVVLIAVGTPPHPITKEADMKYIHAAATELAEYLQGYTVIAIKSTVPVGTGDDAQALITERNPAAQFDLVSLPEFLREGHAVHDFFNPDRIVIGANTERAKEVVAEMYASFVGKSELLYVSRRSAAVVKYAANAFLAVKIHYINEMADFCEKVGADIHEVALGMGLDTRIGNRFLNSGPGYGGSCFPKDTLAMAYMARQNDVEMSIINAAIHGNAARKLSMAHRIKNMVKGIEEPRLAVLGLTFKDGTDDCRESPSIQIIEELLKLGMTNIVGYDPKGTKEAQAILGDAISYAPDMYSAIADSDVVAILTEWGEFRDLDLALCAQVVRRKNIVDCRNLLDRDTAREFGFNYKGIGR